MLVYLLQRPQGPMSDLWLAGDYVVGKVSAIGQPTRPTQPFIPPGSVNEYIVSHVITLVPTSTLNLFINTREVRHFSQWVEAPPPGSSGKYGPWSQNHFAAAAAASIWT